MTKDKRKEASDGRLQSALSPSFTLESSPLDTPLHVDSFCVFSELFLTLGMATRQRAGKRNKKNDLNPEVTPDGALMPFHLLYGGFDREDDDRDSTGCIRMQV